jgi:CIC family chloride channel protein
MPDRPTPNDETRGLLRLGAAAVLAGAATGLLGAVFRMALDSGQSLRDALVSWAHGWPRWGWIFPVAASGAAVALARFLVRFAPLASGSGVQHVEAVARGEAEPAGLRTLPVKFAGGVLAIGAGMVLGREGPTVQMGGVVGEETGRGLGLSRRDRVDLLVASAGSGLAVAFNAPVGGALFVIEEVTKTVRLRLTLMTLLACGVAVAVSRAVLGDQPVFQVPALPDAPLASLVPVLVLGLVAGALGTAYNRSVVAGLDLFAWSRRVPLELRAGIAGGLVGLLAWWSPAIVGGGDLLNQRLLEGAAPLGTLTALLVLRWFLGATSYAVGTPGGLFAPLLLLGATTGSLFHGLLSGATSLPLPAAPAFAAVGMASFFAGVVRAPLTGLVLVVEMTASTTLIVPMLVACFGAVAAATALRNPPVYDTLRLRMLSADRARGAAQARPGSEADGSGQDQVARGVAHVDAVVARRDGP